MFDRSQAGTPHEFDDIAEEGGGGDMDDTQSSMGGSTLPGEIKLIVPMPYVHSTDRHHLQQHHLQQQQHLQQHHSV